MNVTVLAETASTITIGWTPPPGQEGYVPTIDGSVLLADLKRHASVDRAASKVKIGKLLDGKPHAYGVNILGVSASGSVTSPTAPPPPPLSGIPNNLGVFAAGAPKTLLDQATSDGLVAAIAASVDSVIISAQAYGISAAIATATDPIVTVRNDPSIHGGGSFWGTVRDGSAHPIYVPIGAKASQGTDSHIVFLQPDGSGWEAWKAVEDPDGNWRCGSLSYFKPGQWNYAVSGARGSSFTLLSGVIAPWEDPIDHALLISLPSSVIKKGAYPPANASDGAQASGIQEGMGLELPPDLDTSGLKPFARRVAEAFKAHGGILGDRDGSHFEIDGLAPESLVGRSASWAGVDLDLRELLPIVKQMRVVTYS